MSEETRSDRNRSGGLSLHTIRNKALYTGFIGGILGGVFGKILYYFNFIKVGPKSFVLTSWNDADWTDSHLGIIISIILIGFISIGVAFIYYLVFKNVNSVWMGLVYGGILWGIVFYILKPLFTNVPPLNELGMSTIISTICLYILYSVFIGYTISYDYAIYKHKKEN